MEIAGQDAELPEIRHRSRVLSLVVTLVFLALGARLFYLQVIEGDNFYRMTAEDIIRTVALPAAPAARPRIAFAVLVEHGGHGGSVAAPVAVEIVENYFDTVVSPDERNPPRVSHRGERRLSATADKPAPEAHVAIKPAPAAASGEVPPPSTGASGGE